MFLCFLLGKIRFLILINHRASFQLGPQEANPRIVSPNLVFTALLSLSLSLASLHKADVRAPETVRVSD